MHVGKKCGGYMCELRELDSVVTEDRVAVWVFQCVACNVSLLSVRRLLICLARIASYSTSFELTNLGYPGRQG